MTIRKINYTVIAPEVEQEIKDKYTKNETDNLLVEKSDKTHNHNLNDLSEKSYNSLDNIPSEFNPTQHTHIEGEITDLDKYTKNEVDNKLSQKQNNIGYIPENIANKGIANGYASLDSNAKIPLSQLPDTAKQQTYVVDNGTERSTLSSLIEGDKCFEVSTGDSYIWNGTEWLISAKADWENVNLQWVNIIDKPNSSVSNIDDAVDKKHEHNNLTLLQSITQTLIDKWNSAWEHITDSIKHITSAERTLWNTVTDKVDKVTGKGLSTEDYTTAEKNKLLGIEDNANNYVHPITSGNKHIPSGGSSGQFLKWQSDGVAVWDSVPGGLILGETSSTAYRGDRGKIAFDHSQTDHAPADAGLIIP